MESIVIRQHNSKLTLMLIALFVASCALLYFVFYCYSFNTHDILRIVYIAGFILLLFVLFNLFNKIRHNIPVLIFTHSALAISVESIKEVLAWSQIIDWKIILDNGTKYLVVTTNEAKKYINISWLEIKDKNLEDYLFRYYNNAKQINFN